MNINEVGAQLSNILNKSSSLFISSGDSFARELTLGQIIKGKVLRSYDNARYEVSFGGQNKTVDSAVPLKVGESINGRVIGVGEQIEIKKLTVSGENSKTDAGLIISGKWESLIAQGMRDYHVKFNAQQRADIIKVMKQVDSPNRILLSAVALVKQNMEFNMEMLHLLNKLQTKEKSLSLFEVSQLAPKVVLEDATEASVGKQFNPENILALTAAISEMVSEQENKARENGMNEPYEDVLQSSNENTNGDLSDHKDEQFNHIWYLVNNQVEGAVQHRVSTIPIWINERLIEVDVAMYEQRKNLQNTPNINNKKIIFSLDLENLGSVSVELMLNNKHIKMAITTDGQESTEALLSHGIDLTDSIKEQAWSLDEISYMSKSKDEVGNVIGSVLEHFVTQGSLSRLM